MGRAVKNFKKYQYLLYELVKKEIILKYRRSYLGLLWTLIEPILTTIVLTIVFSYVMGKGGATFPVYILTGRLLYSYYSNATKGAMKSIRHNSAMIKKVYVPKYMYPLSAIIADYIMFLISMIVLFGAAIIFKVWPTMQIVFAIVPLIILFVFALGSGLILSTLAVFFRDLEYLWVVMLMMIMYSSAIFYYTDKISPQKLWILKINPLFNIITNFRNAVFGTPIDVTSLVMSACVSVVSVIIGLFMFYKEQDKFILNI